MTYKDIKDPYLASFVGTHFKTLSNRGSVQKLIHGAPNKLIDGLPNEFVDGVPNKMIDGVPNKIKMTYDTSNKIVRAKAGVGTKRYGTEKSLNSLHDSRVLLNSSVKDSESLTLASKWKGARTGQIRASLGKNTAINIDESEKKMDAVLTASRGHYMNRMLSRSYNASWENNLDLLKLVSTEWIDG